MTVKWFFFSRVFLIWSLNGWLRSAFSFRYPTVYCLAALVGKTWRVTYQMFLLRVEQLAGDHTLMRSIYGSSTIPGSPLATC